MLMLGCKPPGRHTEQHDIFFGIATSMSALVPQIKAFWPEPERIHIDAWREVTHVDGYQVSIQNKEEAVAEDNLQKLFFINLGGYQENKFEEQHYVLLTVTETMATATQSAKATLFYKHNQFAGATSHIDDKYGIDVDDVYQVEDILPAHLTAQYHIALTPSANLPEDEIHLGYLKMSVLEKGVIISE